MLVVSSLGMGRSVACDAVVTGTGRNRYIWKGIGGNSLFVETASDALRSN